MIKVTQADREAARSSGLGLTSKQERVLEEVFARHRIALQAELIEALVQHNDALRSAKSVADRNGDGTNWVSFRGRLTYTLAEYHDLVTAARADLAKAKGEA